MKCLKLPAKSKKALVAFIDSWENKISEEIKKLQDKLAEEFKKSLVKFTDIYNIKVSAHFYADEPEEYTGYYKNAQEVLTALDGNITQTAELFVNNAMIESSLGADPFGDWDGKNRLGVDNICNHAIFAPGLLKLPKDCYED